MTVNTGRDESPPYEHAYMKYNPDKHHHHSIRLKEYDYSQAGAYFVTICTKDRECLFGDIVNGEMRLNNAGQMIPKWWYESANKFKNIAFDEFVIMPNHFHGIIVIVGATLCGCPDLCGCPGIHDHPASCNAQPQTGQPHRVAPTLGNIIDWFKTMTTNEYIRNVRQHNWPPFNGRLWQRNYYEHIIRNEKALGHVRRYIIDNPGKWAEDENNPGNIVHRRGERFFAPTDTK